MTAPGRSYVSIDTHATLKAFWDERLERLFITDRDAGVTIIIPTAAAERLAAELVVAVADSTESARQAATT